MPNPNTISRGNIIGEWALAVTLSPTSCSATTTTLQTFTVTGLQLGDIVDVTTNSPISTTGGLGIINSRVSAANTLQLEFINPSNGVITPTASTVYTLLVSRPEQLTATNVSALTFVS
jgi:hypothetical protein